MKKAIQKSQAEIDDAYDNGSHIPDSASFVARWPAAADAFRKTLHTAGRARLDLRYGTAEAECLDLFLPAAPGKGLMVFVHGGYWRAFGRKDWSHLAKGAVDEGYAVAIPSYTLCPAIRISGITRQIKSAVECVAQAVDGPIFLTGHSAGGHLVARLCCEDIMLQEEVANRIQRIVPISGLFDSASADQRLHERAAAAGPG